MRQVICLFVYIGNVCLHWKKPRFTAFLDSNLHTRLAIVTKNELGLAFPPRNLPKKFPPDPSTFYLVIVVTNRQTAGDSIIPRFHGDKNNFIVLFIRIFGTLSFRTLDAVAVHPKDRQPVGELLSSPVCRLDQWLKWKMR